jgi:hypothetical protein
LTFRPEHTVDLDSMSAEWTLERGDPHPRRAESPGSRSSPSRADGGHIAGHIGKAASSPASLKRDNEPVLGGYRSPVEKADRR